MKIPFSPPDITEAEVEQVAEALRSGWITTGPKTKELERQVADLCGVNRAVSLFFSFDMETAKDIVEEIWYIKNEDYRGQNNFAYYKVLLYEFYEKIVTDEFLDLA